MEEGDMVVAVAKLAEKYEEEVEASVGGSGTDAS
jgi:hypothetical protein